MANGRFVILNGVAQGEDLIVVPDHVSAIICGGGGTCEVFLVGGQKMLLTVRGDAVLRALTGSDGTKSVLATETGSEHACPSCGGPMVERASRGGSKFLGCRKFPECRGARNIDGSVGRSGSQGPSRTDEVPF